MKVQRLLKIVFYLSFSILYLSGVADFVLGKILTSPMGSPPEQALALRVHGIAGLWFLFLFGHFFKAHILPSLRGVRHRRTGILLWLALGLLSVSVPLLYYLSNETLRDATVFVHTYLGIAVLAFLLMHIGLAIFRRSP